MVFESVVTDLMNRYLSDFIENLDKKQLNIGIWGGDVVLQDLKLKQDALKELDLPVQTVYGRLGKLVLKIPWKNLYSQPVIVDVEDLYLLVVPNTVVSYNAEKYTKSELEAKKVEIGQYEAAKKRQGTVTSEPANKSFTEKVVAQIINNVQINIKNIHVRYEDRSTSTIPFAMGITLSSFILHTTDANWNKTFLSEALRNVFKIAKVEGFAVYMNCKTTLFESSTDEERRDLFLNTIATTDVLPQHFLYILGPINLMAKLKLNMNPEFDNPPFVVPKVDLYLDMEKLAVGITRSQYQRFIELIENIGAMTRGLPYRKHRPYNTPYKGNYKTWWKFAYTAIVETQIKRIRKEWSWDHIHNHVQQCKGYAECYRTKLITKKPTAAMIKDCEEYEETINNFNIFLIREQVEVEVSSLGLLHEEPPQQSSWFSGWWYGKETKPDDTNKNADILGKFKTAMTPEEKQKLYQAIGYREGGIPTELPNHYVALKMQFHLNLLEICVKNEGLFDSTNLLDLQEIKEKQTVLSLQIQKVCCNINQRPADSGIDVAVHMNKFTVFGYKQDEFLPILIKSKVGNVENTTLLDVKFELNPMDQKCDQRVCVSARPLKIVYDAETIIQLLQVFKLPKNTNLSELTDAATYRLNNIKERSATGMQYMIEKHTRIELDISLMPNYVIIPYKGILKNTLQVMVISLGKITLKTPQNTKENKDVVTMYTSGITNEEIMKIMLEQAYDTVLLDIEDIQVLLASPFENWRNALQEGEVTEMHILTPTSLYIKFDMCVVDDDPRLPKHKVAGHIPRIGLSLAEIKILESLSLLYSIPLPQDDATDSVPLSKQLGTMASNISLTRYMDDHSKKSKMPEIKKDELSEEIVQYTNVVFDFIIKEISIDIYRNSTSTAASNKSSDGSQYHTPTDEFFDILDCYDDATDNSITDSENMPNTLKSKRDKKLSFQLKQLELGIVQKTFEMTASIKLGAILMDQFHPPNRKAKQNITHIIETPEYGQNNSLVSLNYTNANKLSPEFTTKYKSVEQLIEFNFEKLIIRLHQEGLLELLQTVNRIQTKIEVLMEEAQQMATYRVASAGNPQVKTKLTKIIETPGQSEAPIKVVKKRAASLVDSIKVKLIANMEQLTIKLECIKRPIADLQISSLQAGVVLKTSYTEVKVKLHDIIIMDMNTKSIHPKILSVVGDDALSCQIVLYNVKETSDYNSDDMKIDVSMGCVKIIFLKWFINSILNFLDHFQAATAAIAEASAMAAESAKQNVVGACTNTTRMKINIGIKAPIIIIPVDSSSLHAITIDFGYLNITNLIAEVPNSANENGPALVDDIKLELSDMKIGKGFIRQTVSDTSSPQKDESKLSDLSIDDTMLSPTSFTLSLKRNLSASWYKEIAEIDISGRLHSILINLMRDDYQMLMLILNRNMTEGANELSSPIVQKKPISRRTTDLETEDICPDDDIQILDNSLDEEEENEVAKSVLEIATKKIMEPIRDDLTSRETSIALDSKKMIDSKAHEWDTDGSPKSSSKIDTFLKFSFQMDSITCNMKTDKSTTLASFGIYFLSVKGVRLVDDSMSASIVLSDVQLDDSRPGRENYITKFIKKRETPIQISKVQEGQPSVSMVDIVIRLTANETYLNLKICGFDLILSLEFLNQIVQFIHVPEDETILANTKPVAGPSTAVKQSHSPQTTVDTKNDALTAIFINIEEPDIILVEQMDDINCMALILNSRIALRARMKSNQQIIHGEISDLRLCICEFNPARRNSTRHYVLQPCSLVLHAYSTSVDTTGMRLSLSVSEVRLNISPVIIELINKTIKTITGSEASAENTCEELPNYSDIWKIKKYNVDDYWFMKVDDAEDALIAAAQNEQICKKTEICIVEVPSIAIVMETGVGYYTYPMLAFEMKMNAEINDWSTNLLIKSSLSLGMAYYNSQMAVWESMIEPNERELANGLKEYGPWELDFSIKTEKILDDAADSEDMRRKICISSTDVLEMTITKTCIDVLKDLGAAFSDAIRPEGLHKPEITAPYIIQNDTGFDIIVNLKLGALQLHSSHLPTSDSITNNGVVFTSMVTHGNEIDPKQITTCQISPGGRAYMEAKNTTRKLCILGTGNSITNQLEELFIYVKISNIDKEISLPIHKADRRYFPLYRDTNKEPWGIISNVKTEYGSTIVTIHGVLEIKNHFSTSISVFRLRRDGLYEVGKVQPYGTFNVPLHALYAVPRDLFFSVAGYKTSVQGINWKENPSDFMYTKYLQCDPIHTFEPFYMTVVREREDVFHEVSSKYTMLSACYTLNLKPPLYLKNSLPVDIHISVAGCSVAQSEEGVEAVESLNIVQKNIKHTKRNEDFLDYGEKVVKPGDILHLPTVKMSVKEGDLKSFIVARLVQYLEKDWSCSTEIPSNPPEFAVWSFTSYDSVEKMTLDLGVNFENRHGSLQLTIYCPFWMINKTGQILSYMSSDENVNILYHPPELEGPILFSYREKVFFGKKRASIRVDSGEWSERFALDAAGSTGVVECKTNDMTYEIAVRNTLTNNSLTKQIVFTPMYVLINKAPFAIKVQEDRRPGDPWIYVEPDQCAPLWPKETTGRRLRVKTEGDDTSSSAFSYNEVHCCLLKMDNKYGGINVDIQITEGSVYITFLAYHPGDAPVLIINHTTKPISFWEKGNINERKLAPLEMMLYTWVDPAGEKMITWNDQNRLIETDLRRDDADQFKLENENTFWVSFLNGTQRILLFTNNGNIATETHSASRLDKVTQEIEVDIHGIGFSLVNNIKRVDIMYVRIASSGVIWEEQRKQKYFKQMKIEEVQTMEMKYQQFLRETSVGNDDIKFYLDAANKIEIDFEHFILKKPMPRPIRRTFYPGFWIQIKSSPYTLQFHAKINRIQIDNQLNYCIFPVVLAPTAPPKSIAALTALKPFMECSIVQRVIPYSDVKQFKYLTVLIQEFHVKVDLLFINEIIEIVSSELTDEESQKRFADDIERQKEPLSALALTQSSQEIKNFYDQLHLGPLKIHISFSMAGLEPGALPHVLSTILQGVGVTLTDINDVVLRLSYFERQYTFFSHPQLITEIGTHYKGQAIKQAYVLILGLDVIGNPYGLVVGFTKGVEDLFYEPFQGLIQGPGEFAEGLVLGVRSLFGHTVGGAAGAVSKITGAMGKGLAALTFDKDYQKKRREQLNKKPANLQEGLARSGKGLVMGVVDGVAGVFTKPISGAKQEGVEGFFKGLGKGAVGLVARPTAGIVDFASGTFDTVKRATEMSEDTNRLRPPRFLHSDGIVRPFCLQDAEGFKLIKELEKGKYAHSDVFAHYDVIVEKRDVILLSDQRILYCIKNDIFGNWQVEWTYRWKEIVMIHSEERGIIVTIGEKNKKVIKLFGSNEPIRKLILISQPAKREHILSIMSKLRSNAT